METGYEKFTGTCLCIRFEQSDIVVDFEQQKSNDSLMELFLFGHNSFISDKAQFKLAITPYTLNKETSLPSEQRLDHKIGLKLFVDTFHFPDKNDGEINFKRTFLRADEG